MVRPMLRPGLHVVRRDSRTLQLGLEWPGVAALPASEGVLAVLDAVDGFRDVAGVVLAAAASGVAVDDARQAVEALIDAGALVDQAVVKPATVTEPTWAALWLLAGPRGDARAVLHARQSTSVHVIGTGALARSVTSLLKEEHLPLTPDLKAATVLVLVADRELPREVADDAMRAGSPYLCVGIRELVGLVGPFVVPGSTACLRCVDLSRADLDSCWRTVIAAADDSSVAAPTYPPSLLAAVAGYAAQEVALWASGALPVSCDNVVEFPYGLGEVQAVAYPPHPQCGCGWRAGRETMSA